MEETAVVIDCGTATCRSGFSGDAAPCSCFPSVVGHPKQSIMAGMDSKSCVGEEALMMGGNITQSRPIDRGVITNWDDMDTILSHTFSQELHVTPSEHPILMAESPTNPKANREKMIQIMFQRYGVPKYYAANPASLALYSTGRITGMVLDSGEGTTHAVPVFGGYVPNQNAIQRSLLAGCDVTELMRNYLKSQLNVDYGPQNTETVRDIKENLCYVSQDYEAEVKAYNNPEYNSKAYQLPDNNHITLRSQRIRCPEVLFKPKIMNKQALGLHELIHQSILKCDADLQRELYNNIVLSGGNTMFPGIAERLSKEVTALAPSTMKTKVTASDQRLLQVWIGGSILSSMFNFETNWITKAEYQETGPSVVHRKCSYLKN